MMKTHSATHNLISQVSADSWKQELEVAASRYNVIGAWVAIFFDPLFAFTDYINLPDNWLQLLIIRLGVALVTLVTLGFRKKYGLSSYTIILVPFLLISLQNAYTYALIDNDDILGHSLNYMALLIGGAMFILWRWTYSVFVIILSASVTAIFISTNSALDKEQFFLNGGFLLIAVGIFMIILIKARYDLTVKEIKARLALKASNEELGRQKEIVEISNKKITDSIQYAKRIQDSILGHQSQIDEWFKDSFVLLKPKDILSGDFYWFYESTDDGVKVVIAADCTGHGVPAAMMTVLGNSILNEIVVQRKIYEPGKILLELDKRIMESFSNRSETDGKVNDGMDVSVLTFTAEKIIFAAAKNPLCVVSAGEIKTIPGSKFPIGSGQYKQEKVFENHTLALDEGSKLYIYSDGFQDQFGGDNNQKYLSKRFREFLLSTSALSMEQQKKKLVEEFEAWKGVGNKNTDDVLIIGIAV
jgi:serine phosphatase RsbU (regulator of sigma subunit)